jgi:hypothetical protein
MGVALVGRRYACPAAGFTDSYTYDCREGAVIYRAKHNTTGRNVVPVATYTHGTVHISNNERCTR